MAHFYHLELFTHKKEVVKWPVLAIVIFIFAPACSNQPEYDEINVVGWSVEIQCDGPPDSVVTVWLENGIGARASADTWQYVLPKVSEFAHVCRYNRPLSNKDSTSLAYGPDAYMQLVAGLLDVVGARNELVVVGHSFGGYPVRVIAQRWPQRVREVILVDAISESLGLLRATNSEDWAHVPRGREMIDLEAFENYMQSTLSMPLTVISREKNSSNSWKDSQQYLLSLSHQSRQIRATGCGHMIPLESPASVINAIKLATRGG